MSDAVIARQQGDTYQAKFFWYKACKLYLQNSNAIKIAWEVNDSPGFDDVSIYYDPPKLDLSHGKEIFAEYFQVKFHVDQNLGFSCDRLMDPSFIGNTSESLLQRLYKNYLQKPDTFAKSLFIIYNTWTIDHSDELKNLIDNNGAIRLDKLFDGTTSRSLMGKIRGKWKKHLSVESDDKLKEILSPLRIAHSSKGLDHLNESLNFSLQAVGLNPIDESKRTSPYVELIQRLHSEKRKEFSKDELREILKAESLLIEESTKKDDIHIIGLRSFRKGADIIEFETNEHLCLLHHFVGRFTKDEKLWSSDIVPALESFSAQVVRKNKPLHIHLDTHQAIAFAFGYYLDTKVGVQTNVIQKTSSGRILFSTDHSSSDYLSYKEKENWSYSFSQIQEGANDTVIALSVTHDINDDVKSYVKSNLKNVSRIISANILETPSFASIRNGNHITLAVQELVNNLRNVRSSDEKKGSIHLFIAAPNALVFTLGQQIKSLGKIKLYEYDLENSKTGTYNLSIELPV